MTRVYTNTKAKSLFLLLMSGMSIGTEQTSSHDLVTMISLLFQTKQRKSSKYNSLYIVTRLVFHNNSKLVK